MSTFTIPWIPYVFYSPFGGPGTIGMIAQPVRPGYLLDSWLRPFRTVPWVPVPSNLLFFPGSSEVESGLRVVTGVEDCLCRPVSDDRSFVCRLPVGLQCRRPRSGGALHRTYWYLYVLSKWCHVLCVQSYCSTVTSRRLCRSLCVDINDRLHPFSVDCTSIPKINLLCLIFDHVRQRSR